MIRPTTEPVDKPGRADLRDLEDHASWLEVAALCHATDGVSHD